MINGETKCEEEGNDLV